MASDPKVLQAFKAASGVDTSVAHDVFVVCLGGLAMVWLIWVVSGVGQKVLAGQLKPGPALFYVARATVLVMFIVYTLVR